jgi:hypothetical protein
MAAILGVFIWFSFPHDRHVSSVWMLLFKITPFVVAAVGISLIPNGAPGGMVALSLIPLSYLVLLCFFIPRILFSGSEFDDLYYTVLTAMPYMILCLATAYRLGGGDSGSTIRLALAMLILMLSGLEDLAFLLVNEHTDPYFSTIPQVWNWASHMAIFLGHPPTKLEAYCFIGVHGVLAALVLFGPVAWRLYHPGSAARQKGDPRCS